MSFLSQENAHYINQILTDFLKEKHNINLNDNTISEEEYKSLLGNTMTFIHQKYSPQRVNITDMNKIAISELKDKIIGIYNKAKSESSPETEFINKLQKLELQRQTFSSLIPPPAAELKAADMVYSHPQSTSAPVQLPPQTSTTVYMPNPTKMGTEVNISSWQRDWINYPKRNSFTWKGQLPIQLDITNVKIGCLVVHKEIGLTYPLISIFIEGPNELDVHVSVVLDKIVGEYAIYKPVTESLSLIYLLALPWKITLEAIDGEEINLGFDKIPFKVERVTNNYTSLIVPENMFKEGDLLRLYNESSKRILASQVIRSNGGTIDVLGQFQYDGYLLNFTKQFTIILETHSILQKK